MHRERVEQLQPGSRLGKTLYDEQGRVLLARGAELGPRYQAALAERGYRAIYVLDGEADDLEPAEPITGPLRSALDGNLRTLFALLGRATAPVRDQAARDGAHALPAQRLTISPELEQRVRLLYTQVEALLDEVLEADVVAGMVSLKDHDAYTFEHSVDVAVYGVLLGGRLGFERAWLRDLALGCLLHDVGKQYVDPRILNKPGKLDPDEFARVMEHPVLGFQLVRQMPIDGPRPAAVVLQHHERQDGTGYPKRLFGSNRVARSDEERFDPRRIGLLAEVAAIVDVYAALTADRPYRGALPPHEAFTVLEEAGGHHLNREALATFLALVQPFPVGLRVRIAGGRHDGSLGVVARVPRSAAHRPVVRLLFDDRGRRLGGDTGADLDLRHQPEDVGVRALPDGEAGQPLEALAGRAARAGVG